MLYGCIMANTSGVWQKAAHTTYQLSSPYCSTRAIQKSLTLNQKMFENFLEKVRRMDHKQKNNKAERPRRLGRKTREEVGPHEHPFLSSILWSKHCIQRIFLVFLDFNCRRVLHGLPNYSS